MWIEDQKGCSEKRRTADRKVPREEEFGFGRFEGYGLRGFETSILARDTGLPASSAGARLWAVAVG